MWRQSAAVSPWVRSNTGAADPVRLQVSDGAEVRVLCRKVNLEINFSTDSLTTRQLCMDVRTCCCIGSHCAECKTHNHPGEARWTTHHKPHGVSLKYKVRQESTNMWQLTDRWKHIEMSCWGCDRCRGVRGQGALWWRGRVGVLHRTLNSLHNNKNDLRHWQVHWTTAQVRQDHEHITWHHSSKYDFLSFSLSLSRSVKKPDSVCLDRPDPSLVNNLHLLNQLWEVHRLSIQTAVCSERPWFYKTQETPETKK